MCEPVGAPTRNDQRRLNSEEVELMARQRVLLHPIGYTIRDSSVRIHRVGAKKFLVAVQERA